MIFVVYGLKFFLKLDELENFYLCFFGIGY